MIDVADVEDVDESVAVVATLSRACGDARLCRGLRHCRNELRT
jgi:hypothetical protein